MKRIAASLTVCLAVIAGAGTTYAGLDSDIQKVLDEKPLRGKDYGIEIMRLDASPKIIYSKNASTPRLPASNLKLVTTAASLDRLGSDFKFRTKLLLHGSDLILVGDGDPSLGDSELLSSSGWDTTTVFKIWAKELKKRGLSSISNLLVDDSVFDEVFQHPNWSPDQYIQPHSAEIAGLSLNANLINVTVKGKGNPASVSLDPPSRSLDLKNTCTTGKSTHISLTRDKDDSTLQVRGEIKSGAIGVYQCTIHDPPLFAAGALAQVLADEGITVTGKILRDRTAAEKPGASVVGIHETPLPIVVFQTNKVSQNLYAESLCKRLGHQATGQPGSWSNGTAVVADYLKKIGVSPNDFKLDDGCGLSRSNAIAPHALCQVLAANFYGPNKEIYLKSLPIGGVDGTLKNRFTDKDLRGKVFAKTGFIEGVSSLSGYLQARDGTYYAFSILINDIPAKSNSIYKTYQERIVQAINNNAR